MNRKHHIIGLVHLALLSMAAAPLNLYVSPDGNDHFSGTLARNNANKSDGPFMTVAHACEVVRGFKAANGGKLLRPINIILRGGTYDLHQPLILGAADSGSADAPITYMAYSNERPVLSAGRVVRGWGKASINGHEVWAANVPQLRDAEQAFEELWVDGHRRPMARAPKHGCFQVSGPQEKDPTLFHFNDEELDLRADPKQTQVILMTKWTESHLPIDSIDAASHLVRFNRRAVFAPEPGDRYWVQGSQSMLSEPGEWIFDHPSGTLYYFPMPGEGMVSSQVVIPWHEQAMRLEGEPSNDRFVEYVTFRGITFANSEWSIPPGRISAGALRESGFEQAAIGVPGAIWGQGVRHCNFELCTIEHCGNYGIELAGGCQNNKILYCALRDLGAGGIKIGEPGIFLAAARQTTGNEISDCTIADCGQTFPSAVGIWLGQTSQNKIAHNDIHGLWYTGISVGWTWGYGPTLARNNVIEFNHVHHIGTPAENIEPILSDMGGIYTLGVQPGTVVRNNYFHDIAALKYGGWGIYFDEGSSHIVAENNLVCRTTHGGFHQHYGADNIVRNNVLAFGRDAQIQRTRVEGHQSFAFERNIVYWDSGRLLAGDWSKWEVSFDHNSYWKVGGGAFDFAGHSWNQWRDAGLDLHSQIADPEFIDPAHDNFRLKDNAAAKTMDFVPVDWSIVGPRVPPIGH